MAAAGITHPEIGAVLICPDPHKGGIEVCATGLGEDELTIDRVF